MMLVRPGDKLRIFRVETDVWIQHTKQKGKNNVSTFKLTETDTLEIQVIVEEMEPKQLPTACWPDILIES